MSPGQVAVIVGLVFVIILVVFALATRMRRVQTETPDTLSQVKEAKLEEGERPSTIISEQIEEMVKERLSQHVDLAATELDFVTAADESLEIWVDGVRYAEYADIPDHRIRSAIENAVETFNR